MRPCHIIVAFLMIVSACGTTDDVSKNGPPANNDGYSRCSHDAHVGGFTVHLAELYTSVQGSVADGVAPYQVPETTKSEGSCELLVPPNLVCVPSCESGQTCNRAGSCVLHPENRDVGTITIDGLKAHVSMDPIPSINFYNFTGDLPHPGYEPSAELTLHATGGEIEPFSILAFGVDPLSVIDEEMFLEHNAPATLSWLPSGEVPNSRIRILLSIANHGGIPARVECTTDDTGSFEIPANLVNTLLDVGYSGFPTVTVTRESAGSVSVDYGCVEFVVWSKVVLPVEIPGLTSCSFADDCLEGQICRADLTCGT
ncbi:hypothetical protein ACFL6C_01500 [Myxococcota bacterium]